jgi:hypothetical protein
MPAKKKAAVTTAEVRPLRGCDICGIADTDPRHIVDVGNTNQIRHIDCCRGAGCPDGSCDQVTAGAEELRGDALLEHLTSRSD